MNDGESLGDKDAEGSASAPVPRFSDRLCRGRLTKAVWRWSGSLREPATGNRYPVAAD